MALLVPQHMCTRRTLCRISAQISGGYGANIGHIEHNFAPRAWKFSVPTPLSFHDVFFRQIVALCADGRRIFLVLSVRSRISTSGWGLDYVMEISRPHGTAVAVEVNISR